MIPGQEEKIRARAYEIWEQEGRPADHEHEHWERARREISGQVTAGSPELQEEGGLSTAGAGNDIAADQGPASSVEDDLGNMSAPSRTPQKRAAKPKTSSKK